MSRFIATSAIRGAHQVVQKADEMLKGALEKKGAVSRTLEILNSYLDRETADGPA